MVRTKTEVRREAILAAAQAVFEEVGFERATMSEVTARVGGSKATLYRYFASKEELFRELLKRAASQHSSAVLDVLHGLGCSPEAEAAEALALLHSGLEVAVALQQFGEQVLKIFHTPQRLFARRMVIAAASDSDVGKLFYENGPARGLQHMERYFEAMMEAGSLRKANPKVAAVHFRGLIEAEIDEADLYNARPPLTGEEIRNMVSRGVDVFMRAYGPTS